MARAAVRTRVAANHSGNRADFAGSPTETRCDVYGLKMISDLQISESTIRGSHSSIPNRRPNGLNPRRAHLSRIPAPLRPRVLHLVQHRDGFRAGNWGLSENVNKSRIYENRGRSIGSVLQSCEFRLWGGLGEKTKSGDRPNARLSAPCGVNHGLRKMEAGS